MSTPKEYKHLRVYETTNNYNMKIESSPLSTLPKNDLLIRVSYSSVNYKDALSCYGNKGVTRKYPHTPGIDAVGTVEHSNSSSFIKGDKVIVTGYDLGMNTDGGFSEYISVPDSWAIHLPPNLSEKEAMVYGTAGFTAALSVYELINSGITPELGPILVTGATGGVGSIVIALLSCLNYNVVAATGRLEETNQLIKIGATKVIHRDDIDLPAGKSLLSEKWAGAIDTVGGSILPAIIKSTKYRGCVTCCGNIAGGDLNMTVYPFILRGIRLIGIDSGQTPFEIRNKIWNLLSNEWSLKSLDELTNTITLDQLPETIIKLYNGKHKHRTIVKL